MTRHALPNRRPSVSFDLSCGPGRHEQFVVSIGGDGETSAVQEVFVSGPPSQLMNAVRDSAILLSLALQCGCPLDTIAKALTKDDHDRPATVIGAVVLGIEAQIRGGA